MTGAIKTQAKAIKAIKDDEDDEKAKENRERFEKSLEYYKAMKELAKQLEM